MKGCRILIDTERVQLLGAASIREQALFKTGLYFGARIGEALALRFGDVKGKCEALLDLFGTRSIVHAQMAPSPFMLTKEQVIE
jgi:integrase